MTKAFYIAIAAFAALIVVFFLPSFYFKFFFVLLCITVLCMALSSLVQKTWLKYACILIFSLTLPLTLVEGYHHILTKIYRNVTNHKTTINEKPLILPHADLGYVANPNNITQSQSIYEDEFIYNVTYTIDDKGQRITPKAPNAKTAVLLFGCSYTFGEGLEDRETFAWQLGELLGEEYQVINFAYSGYGAHQMLAILEAGIPELTQYERVLAYYVTIEEHQNRIAGAAPWDKNGPRYTVKDGKALRTGSLADLPPLFWEGELEHWLDKSITFAFYKRQIINRLVPVSSHEEKVELLQAIIVSAKETLQKIHKNSLFSVLAWPSYDMEDLQGLPKDIPVTDVTLWLPNFDEDPEKYKIFRDGHPNALANSLAVKELAEQVKKDVSAL